MKKRNKISLETKTPTQGIQTRKQYLLKRIFISNLLILAVIAVTYLWMIFFLANVGSFWDLFRDKEVVIKKPIVTPVAPYLTPIPEATQEDKIDVTGQSVAGMKIDLFIDGAKFGEIISDSQGSFAFTEAPVGIFQEEIYATASDQDGNTSSKSITYKIVKDTEPPEIKITKPEGGSETYKSTGHAYTITGETEPEATVYINEQLSITNPTTGTFSGSVRLEQGQNTIIVKVVDKALNETEKKVYVNFEKID